jgi:hypothetical protein
MFHGILIKPVKAIWHTSFQGLALATLAMAACTAAAQTARPNIVLSQVKLLGGFPSGGALSGGSPAGSSMTVNSLGNLIVSTSYGGQIAQFNAQTGTATVLGSYNNPGPVAVDSANNLYIADVFDTTITKVPFVSGAYVALSTPSSSTPVCTGADTAECTLPGLTGGIYGYASMTFDVAGNLYLTSTNGGTYANAIFVCSKTCLSAATPAATLVYQEPVSASAQLYIGGIAVDTSGDIFFTDSATNTTNSTSTASNLKELAVAGKGYITTPLTLYAYTVASPGAYDNQLDGVAMDANYVYFATEFDGIYAFPNNGGVVNVAQLFTASTQGAKLLTSDGHGHFFAAAYSNTTSGDAAFSVNIGNAFVGSALLGNSVSATNVLAVLNDVTNCSGSPSVSFISTSSQFSAATSGSCATTNITSASSLPTTLTFQPTGTGLQQATLTAQDSLAHTGTAAVSGTGMGAPAATPQFYPPGSTYTTVQSVQITSATPNATIYYTTDGSQPGTASTQYTGAVAVNQSETIKAIATATGSGNSAVATAVYTLNLPPAPTPAILPGGGTYTSVQSVALSDSLSGAAIYYTLDGTPPTTSSTLYTGQIRVAASKTIKAIATAVGYSTSATASATYIINLPAGTPSFSPPPATYNAVQHVVITSNTPGATVYYTTDGTTPTTSSTLYTSAVTVGVTETLQAIAVAPGYSTSAVGTAAYVINLPTFTLAVSPTSLTVARGGQALTNVTVTPLNGFLSTVTLGCNGLPAGYSCTFTPATITPSSNYSVTSVLAVNVLTTAAALHPATGFAPLVPGTTLALALCLFSWKRRRLRQIALWTVLALVGTRLLTGCSASTSSRTAVTSNITITAASATVQQSATLSITAQ